ncbi:phytoene desaturase family protein [Desmospora profundinema]|uniref:Phytoene dehydrogenase-like protein n=1 Tax=Desmospora profundinema TaxID=1571184 RepID=A0ABU1IPJ4_9BACL|nr:FAD-dependent oxidoreductase [Desmospora profundinema]MDR6226714.1 phytoene dehydrogenase-like protein [Desmospora profundinema]
MKPYDVVVVGGGVSGLAASVYLAQEGYSVVVLEKSDQLGGRAITVKKGGALFNLGGHALYREGEAYQILGELGVMLPGGVPDTKGMAIWKNRLYPIPSGPLSFLTSPLLSAYGKMDFVRFLIRLNRTDPQTLALMSLQEWAEKEIRDPMARHLFYAICRIVTYSNDRSRLPADVVYKQLTQSLKGGVFYVDGGWQTIVRGLRNQAVQLGVSIRNRHSVTSIEPMEEKLRIRLTDGGTMEAPTVLTTVGPEQTYRMVKEADRTALGLWKQKARPLMAACLDLGLKRLPKPNHHLAIGLDQPIFFTNHSRASSLSEDGTIVVHLIQYLDEEIGNPKANERQLEQIMDLLHPGWRNEVVARQYLPQIAVMNDMPRVGERMLFGPTVPEVPGLYIAGDGAGHGEMLADAALASAKRAALEILQKRPVHGSHTKDGMDSLGYRNVVSLS